MENNHLEKREIRIFISSTFRDFMRERDLLVKEVFPALRRKCAQRFVTLTEVDLRWGITEKQANEGQVLPLCLAEIERSRPYFIGLLGERYGWVPDEIAPEVIKKKSWLKEYVGARTSVTELEILHGVLRNPKMEDHAFFYFRDPAYVNSSEVSEKDRRDMVERNIKAEVEEHGEEEASRRTEERKEKLAELKQRIRESGFPVVEPYADPKAVAEIIRGQFDKLIDQLYPEDDTPDPLAQERLAHEAHAKNKLFACIDRPEHLKVLNDFAASPENNGQGLVVTGDSGGGKTSLLAAWARNWVEDHPGDDHFLFQHYFGATPDSTSPEGFLRRLLGELKDRFDITDDIPTDPDELRDALPVWLAQTAGQGHIVLVLDGLNQVRGGEPDQSLRFLPSHFPANVTVLASLLEGPALDVLRERGWAEHDLPLASETEVDAMVGEYLSIHARTLEPGLRRALVTAPGSKNPLYLRVVLEELRQFGSFEELPDRVRHYLESGNPRELFLLILTRWQEDFDCKDPEDDKRRLDLVHRALSHLWAARQGLSEPEWLELLGDGDTPLPRALWTPLFLALEPHLSQRAGLFTFGHDFLRQAVETAFVESGDLQQGAHLAIADYFENHPNQKDRITPRKASEWPFQLHAAEAWDRLESCLTDIPLFLALSSLSAVPWQWELLVLWIPLRERSNAGQVYRQALLKWKAAHHDEEEILRAMNAVAKFHYIGGDYGSAEPLLRQALAIEERIRGSRHPEVAARLNDLAQLLHNTHRLRDAEPLYRRALAIDEQSFGPAHPNVARDANNLSVLLANMKRVDEARELAHLSLTIDEKYYGANHPNVARDLINLGPFAQGPEEHESLVRRALAIDEANFGLVHPEVAHDLFCLAGLQQSARQLRESEKTLQRAIEITVKTCGANHDRVVIYRAQLASQLMSADRLEEAEREFRLAVASGEQGSNANDARLFPIRCSHSNVLLRMHFRAKASLQKPPNERNRARSENIVGNAAGVLPCNPDRLLSESKQVLRRALASFRQIRPKSKMLYALVLVAAANYALIPVLAPVGVWLERRKGRQRKLVGAIREGNIDLIRSILSTCTNVDDPITPEGANALFVASFEGQSAAVALLLEAGASVDTTKSDDGATALFAASQEGYVDVARLLVDAGANVDLRSENGRSSLWAAATDGHANLVRFLVESEADPNVRRESDGATALFMAANGGYAQVVRSLIQGNADLDAPQTDVGATALIVAIQGGHKVVATELIEAGANVNAAMMDGSSPVFMAAREGNLGLLNLLIQKGANVNAAKLPSGATPLMVAVENDDLEMVKTLISSNADVKARLTIPSQPYGVSILAVAKSSNVRDLLCGSGAVD